MLHLSTVKGLHKFSLDLEVCGMRVFSVLWAGEIGTGVFGLATASTALTLSAHTLRVNLVSMVLLHVGAQH